MRRAVSPFLLARAKADYEHGHDVSISLLTGISTSENTCTKFKRGRKKRYDAPTTAKIDGPHPATGPACWYYPYYRGSLWQRECKLMILFSFQPWPQNVLSLPFMSIAPPSPLSPPLLRIFFSFSLSRHICSDKNTSKNTHKKRGKRGLAMQSVPSVPQEQDHRRHQDGSTPVKWYCVAFEFHVADSTFFSFPILLFASFYSFLETYFFFHFSILPFLLLFFLALFSLGLAAINLISPAFLLGFAWVS